MKVARDRKKIEQKEKERQNEQLVSTNSLRYEILRNKNKQQNQEKLKSNNEQINLQQFTAINEEYKKILQKRHLNFFEEEEKVIEQMQKKEQKIQNESDKFKDKPYDETTKFMGKLATQQSVPWYIKEALDDKYIEKKQNPRSKNVDENSPKQIALGEQIKAFRQNQQSYYTILNIEPSKNNKQKRDSNEHNNDQISQITDQSCQINSIINQKEQQCYSKQKYDKEEQRLSQLNDVKQLKFELKKHKKEIKKLKKEYKKIQHQKLLQERINREKNEYLRELQLLQELFSPKQKK